jgi:hypothetical protein
MSNSDLSLSGAAESLRPKFGDPVGDVLKHAGSVKEAYGKWLGFFIMLFALLVSARWFVAGIVTAYLVAKKLS